MLLYDSVLFDLDGTLPGHPLQDLAESTNYALVSSGFPARSLEEIRAFVGNGVARLIHLAVPDGTSEFLRRAVSGTVRTLLPRPYEL